MCGANPHIEPLTGYMRMKYSLCFKNKAIKMYDS